MNLTMQGPRTHHRGPGGETAFEGVRGVNLGFVFFLAVLGLCGCTRAFSSCRVRAAHRDIFPCYGAQALVRSSLVALGRVESSQTGDQTRVPCTSRWILLFFKH